MTAPIRNTGRVRGRRGAVAALDLGSNKMCCFIARREESGPKIIGIGHQVSGGIRNGLIVDMDEAEASVRATVEAAEHMAGETVSKIYVGLTAGHPMSQQVSRSLPLNGRQIGEGDLARLIDYASLQKTPKADQNLLHVMPIKYTVDGNRIKDPRGMYGDNLGVELHTVLADANTLRNLETCINRCHLEVAAMASAPHAAGLACLKEEERRLGTALIDMGAGTTTMAIYMGGELAYTASIPVGGSHVTNDIARGLSISLSDAERIKVLYGNALASPFDDHEEIKMRRMGSNDDLDDIHLPRSMLVNIVQPRLEEIFEMVRAKINETGYEKVIGRQVVLTGGASQLSGAPELAQRILGRQTRIGLPVGIKGLAQATEGPGFSVAAGLLKYAMSKPVPWLMPVVRENVVASGPLGRLGNWLRENF